MLQSLFLNGQFWWLQSIRFLFSLNWIESDMFCISGVLSFQMVYRSAMGFPALCPWACLRVRSYLSHLSYSGCWCRRLLSSFPGHGAEPAWWQHRLITVRRFTERDVHHSRLHCFYYGQTNPEHRQTGERVWWSLDHQGKVFLPNSGLGKEKARFLWEKESSLTIWPCL